MKKFVLGVLFGALIFGGTSVLADSVSLIGKSIQNEFPVFYNNERLEAKAIAVDGVSYLPVRAIGDALGARVEFRDGAIYVEKQDDYEAIKEEVMHDIRVEQRKEELREEIARVQAAIESMRSQISNIGKEMAAPKEDGIADQLKKLEEALEKTLQQQQQKLAELEEELKKLEQQQSGQPIIAPIEA